MVQQDPEKDPGSRYKWSKRILILVRKDPIQIWTLMQRSCTIGPTRSWILIRAIQKILIHKPCTSSILIEVVKRILIQRSCTSATTGSRHKWPKRILIQRSCYKCRADLPSLLVGVHSHTDTLFGVSCRDNLKERTIEHKALLRQRPQSFRYGSRTLDKTSAAQ